MERLVIEKLEGAHRNSVEGVTNAPEVVKNLDFDRGGGYKPLGGIESNWLGDRTLSGILDENGEGILYEAGDDVGTEWRPATFFGDAEVLAYDENGMALLEGSKLWFGNELSTLTGDRFTDDTTLALAPRAGILPPWSRDSTAITGSALYITTDGVLTYGTSAGTVDTPVTETAGTGVIAGTYEFIWWVEAPTDNGLVTYAVGFYSHTVSAEIESCSITLDTVFPVGSAIRFYYRPTTQDRFERFTVVISDGVNAPEATLDGDITAATFVPTGDALVNFAGGRVEPHNGRMWGQGATPPFVGMIPSSQIIRTGGYMLVSGGTYTTEYQYGPVTGTNSVMAVVNDYVEMYLQRIAVTRPSSGKAVYIPLFSNLDAANDGFGIACFLSWQADETTPMVRLYYWDGTTVIGLATFNVPLSQFSLGLASGSTVLISGVTIRGEVTGLTNTALDGWDYDTSWTVTLDSGASVTKTSGSSGPQFTGWTTYQALASTELHIGRAYSGWSYLDLQSLGSRELRVGSLEVGNDVTTRALGDIEDYEPADGLTWTSSSPSLETWTTSAVTNMVIAYETQDVTDEGENAVTNPALTLVYSTTGSVNRGSIDNFLTFSPLASSRITALSSTPAGLLVFMENETFLVRGDPATGDLASQRLSGTLGCDPGVIPARMGSVVMPIYKGEVFAVNLGGGDVDFGGSMVNISRPIWLPDDPFIQVVGEAKRQHVVARTAAGRVYRMDVSEQKWMNDPFDGETDLRWFLPADTDTLYGTRYNVGGYLDVVSDDLVATPLVAWTDLDGGDKNLMKLWRRMEVFTEGVGDGTPTLTYTARGASETVNGIDKGEGRWVFTFKRGIVSPTVGLQLEFLGATEDFVMEPPVVIEYVPRYRQR
jgi:hypothetical protein